MVAGRKPQTGFVVRQAFAIQRSAQAPFSCLRTDCKQALENPPSRSAARCGPACAACWPRRCTGARRRAGQLADGRSRPIPARDCAWRLPANKNISATAKPDGRELSDGGSVALLKARLIAGPMQGQGGRGGAPRHGEHTQQKAEFALLVLPVETGRQLVRHAAYGKARVQPRISRAPPVAPKVQSDASSVRGLGAHGSGTPGARLMSQLTLSRLLRDSNRFTDRRARALRHSKPRAASRASSFAA